MSPRGRTGEGGEPHDQQALPSALPATPGSCGSVTAAKASPLTAGLKLGGAGGSRIGLRAGEVEETPALQIPLQEQG